MYVYSAICQKKNIKLFLIKDKQTRIYRNNAIIYNCP